MKMKKLKQETLRDLKRLLKKREDFIKSDVIIATIPELKSGGDLREVINELRISGCPIISSSKGYKWSNNEEEIMTTIQGLHSRADKINSAAEVS